MSYSSSLKHDLKNRIIHDMILKSKGDEDAIVLVLGPVTSRIISSCCRMYDLMDIGVLCIENIQLTRECLDMSVIYFVAPTQENIRRIITDFSDRQKLQYTGYVNLYFTSQVSDELLAELSECRSLVKRMKTLEELNINFLANESRIFTLRTNMNQSHQSILQHLYWPVNRESLINELRQTAQQLVSLCVTCHQLPIIRFTTQSDICRTLATFIELELQEYKQRLPTWKHITYKEDKNNVLLIVDRMLDPIAPVIHEFTYQAMIHDLFLVNGDMCYVPQNIKDSKNSKDDEKHKDSSENKGEEKEKESNGSSSDEKKSKKKSLKEEIQSSTSASKPPSPTPTPLVLSEDDTLWCEFRHQHIGQVMQRIHEKFLEFRKQNKMVGILKDMKKATITQMLHAMKDIPEYKSILQKYQKHMILVEECRKQFDRRSLELIGNCEQDIVTGLTEEQKPIIDLRTLKHNVIKLLANSTIPMFDKLRLTLVYLLAQNSNYMILAVEKEKTYELLSNIDVLRRELQQSFSTFVQPFSTALLNSERLRSKVKTLPAGDNERLSKPQIQQLQKQEKKRLEMLIKRNDESQFNLMRYVPTLHTVMSELCEKRLSEEQYVTMSVVDEEDDQSQQAQQATDNIVPAAHSLSTSKSLSGARITSASSPMSSSAPTPDVVQGKSLRKKNAANGAGDNPLANADAPKSPVEESKQQRPIAVNDENSDDENGSATASDDDGDDATKGSSKKHVASEPKSSDDRKQQARTIVFVLGGLSFNEMRSCYEVANATKCNLILGSTHLATPKEYIRHLCDAKPKHFNKYFLEAGEEILQLDDKPSKAEFTAVK